MNSIWFEGVTGQTFGDSVRSSRHLDRAVNGSEFVSRALDGHGGNHEYALSLVV